jgi:DNA-binding IclR family transcriptional regulator
VTSIDEAEAALLRLLADERDRSGLPGYLETAAIAERLRLPAAQVRRTIHSLWVKGLVGTDAVDMAAAYLLPGGYEAARGSGAA